MEVLAVMRLEPVNTVFGPFQRDPVEAIARALRGAISNMITGPGYCMIHGEPEDGPAYLMCFECGHAFPTPEALLADHVAMVERLNAQPIADPRIPDAPPALMEAATDPETIWSCPHCAHDL